jgi:TRAP-type C4-dicarboxylate transport system permease small subunit
MKFNINPLMLALVSCTACLAFCVLLMYAAFHLTYSCWHATAVTQNKMM